MTAMTTTIRSSTRRRLLAVVTAVLISLGLQPCALAAVSDASCPHAAHGAAVSAAGGHHGHGSTEAHVPCDVAQSPCCDAGVVAFDGRSVTTKSDDGGDFDAAPPVTAFDRLLAPYRPPDDFPAVPAPPPPGRPLHVLNCVFLD